MKIKEINLHKLHCNQKGMALVVSLLILVMVTALGLAGIMLSSTEVKLGGNERVASETLYAADAGIQHAMRALRGQNFDVVTAAPQPWLVVTDFNGVQGLGYSIEVSKTNIKGNLAPDNTVYVTATGKYPSGETRKIEAEVRNVSTMVPVNASLGVSGGFSRIRFQGNTTINGDLPAGETPVAGSDCAQNKAGVGVDTVSAYDEIRVKGGATITGIGMDPSIQLRPEDMNPTEVQTIANTLAANADRTILVDDQKVNNPDVSWGTQANPEVTVISMTGEDARIKFNGDADGYGILIINSETTKKGRVEFNGGFNWTGLIIITGNTSFDRFKSNGNDSITGAVLLANTSEDPTGENFRIKSNGNSSIQYSCIALSNAVNNAPLSLNAWHEVL